MVAKLGNVTDFNPMKKYLEHSIDVEKRRITMTYDVEKLKDILQDAGWYQGRKNDMQSIAEHYRTEGTPLSNEQIAFLEEYGDIEGVSNTGDTFKFFSDPLFWHRINPRVQHGSLLRTAKTINEVGMSYLNPLNLRMVREHITMLEIGWIDMTHIPLHISSDGRLFRDDGHEYGKMCMDTLAKLLMPWAIK